jgi:hypothetical protein
LAVRPAACQPAAQPNHSTNGGAFGLAGRAAADMDNLNRHCISGI